MSRGVYTAEPSTLVRVPASLRVRLLELRRKVKDPRYPWSGEHEETLGEVIARLAGKQPTKADLVSAPAVLSRPKAVVNKRGRGRRRPGRRHG